MEPRRKAGRPKGSDYPHKVIGYLDDKGLDQLADIMDQRGLSQSALLRILIREEAARLGIQPKQRDSEPQPA